MSEQLKPIIVQPGGGKDLHAFGNVVSVLIAGDQTNDSLAVMFDTTPPGGGPPPHIHANEDELFLVVEGQISYSVDGQWTEVGVGGAVYLPKGIVHCYRNVGTTHSRHWVITCPAGFEKCFARCAEEFAKSGGPDMSRIIQISREHGIEILS
jgi:quercetin dioxygenase-like cupin family protein